MSHDFRYDTSVNIHGQSVITGSYIGGNHTHHHAETEFSNDQESCLRSLAFEDMDQRRFAISNNTPGTCSWILKHQAYEAWQQSQNGLLWIKGKPGAGKSTIVKYVLDLYEQEYGHSIASCFFNGRGTRLQKSMAGLSRTLLHQVLKNNYDELQKFFLIYADRYKTIGKYGQRWSWDSHELLGHLRQIMQRASSRQPLFVFVDAVDESGETTAVETLRILDEQATKSRSSGGCLKIIVASRVYPNLGSISGDIIDMEEEIEDDVAMYLRSELLAHMEGRPDAAEIGDLIRRKAAGIFQWVSLVAKEALRLHRNGAETKEIIEAIENSPDELNMLYKQVLGSVQSGREELLLLMQWVCLAKPPLTPKALREALVLGLEIKEGPFEDLQQALERRHIADLARFIDKIKYLSRGLLEVVEEHTVQFIHESVNDYLLRNGGLQDLQSGVENAVVQAQYSLLRCCVRFMQRNMNLDSGNVCKKYDSQSPGLFEYAVLNWTWHLKASHDSSVSCTDLFQICGSMTKPFLRLWALRSKELSQRSLASTLHRETSPNLLQILASSGCLRMVETTLNSQPWWATKYATYLSRFRSITTRRDLADGNEKGLTPLHHACASGHAAVVKCLLMKGYHPDVRTSQNSTPLQFSAACGHNAIVLLLLESGKINVRRTNNEGFTAFWIAAFNGHYDVVETLLKECQAAANDFTDSLILTPLMLAVHQHHDLMVELLCKYAGVDVNLRGKDGRTALSLAATRDSLEPIRILLAKSGIAIDLADNKRQTPLHLAVNAGLADNVKLLLDAGASVRAIDLHSQTPLLAVSQRCVFIDQRHSWQLIRIITLLLEAGSDPDAQDTEGLTALSYVIFSTETVSQNETGARIKAIQLLLAAGAKVDVQDKSGLTPLLRAAWSNDINIMESILGHTTNVNMKDIQGNSALHLAFRTLIKSLCQYDDFEDLCDYAVRIYELLVDAGVDTTAQDNQGRTAFAVLKALAPGRTPGLGNLPSDNTVLSADDLRVYLGFLRPRFIYEHRYLTSTVNDTDQAAPIYEPDLWFKHSCDAYPTGYW